MAIIELARIQVRRGQENQTGVPLLEGGEFAWAADTEKLYIGLKREDGGARNANVEILTENHLRNFFKTLSPLSTTASYVYRVGSDLTLNPDTVVNPFQIEFERTVQSRLDDNDVSILNFGDVGQGGDATQIIQYAHDNLFLNVLGKTYVENTSQDIPIVPTARTLRLPTGIYNIQESIFIAKGTRIVGEGPGKTIIRLTSAGHYAFQTCSFQSNKGSYGTLPGVLAYVKYGDPAFGSGNTEPDDILIENLTIEYDASVPTDSAFPMIGLHGADHAIIRNVTFRGNYQVTAALITSTHCAIELKGTEMISCESVVIDSCRFENLVTGVISNHDIRHPIIQNCKFSTCDRGIVFNEDVDDLAQYGPRFGRISFNRFETIKREAMYFGPNLSNWSTNHLSQANQFINVGNQGNNEGQEAGTAVLRFLTSENRTTDDYFDRFEFHLNQVNYTGIVYNLLVEGPSTLDLVRSRSMILQPSQNRIIARLPVTNETQKITVHFTVSGGMSGDLLINVSDTGDTTITEYYNVIDDTPSISWAANLETPTAMRLRAFNNGATNLTLTYSVTVIT